MQGRPVWVRPWLYVHTSDRGFSVPVLLLDTDVEQNDPADRVLTDRLYGGDHAYRLKQELVLGVGGARILRALRSEERRVGKEGVSRCRSRCSQYHSKK